MISVGLNGNEMNPFPSRTSESIEDNFSEGSFETEPPFARPNSRRSPSLKKPCLPPPGEQVIPSVEDGGHFVCSRKAANEFCPPRVWTSCTASVLFMLRAIKSKSSLAKGADFRGGWIRVVLPVPFRLRRGLGRTRIVFLEERSEELSPGDRSLAVQVVHRVLSGDRHLHLGQHFARVETLCDNVQRRAHLFRIFEKRVKTWRHPPVLWQQRLVQIPAAVPGNGFPDCFADVMAEIGGNDQVRIPFAKFSNSLRIIDIRRVKLFHAMLFGKLRWKECLPLAVEILQQLDKCHVHKE